MSRKAIQGARLPYSISQNFLTCTRTIDRLLNLTTIQRGDHVLEIGPGKGHITRRLLPRCARITAVEIDPALCRTLSTRFESTANLRLICADFLRTPLPSRGAYKVFSNLPFNCTSAILEKLTAARNLPLDCWLIMEKGAAKRFAGLPRETARSLSLKPFFDVRILHHLRREDFHPMPSVDVVMVHLHRKETPDILPAQRPLLASFVQAMLRQAPGRAPMSRRQAADILHRAGLGDIPQSATMRYVQWLCLFRSWAHLPQEGGAAKKR